MEHGLYIKHIKVEVYLLEFKLCLHSNPTELCLHSSPTEVTIQLFSRACVVGKYNIVINLYHNITFTAELEERMREILSVARDAECIVT